MREEMLGFHYVNVTTKGYEGTLNLFFSGYCLAFIPQIRLADLMRKRIEANDALIEAALNMVDVKGRHHSEIPMNRLIEASKEFREVQKLACTDK